MKKIPIYIGVFAEDYKTAEKDLRFQCKEALNQLKQCLSKNQQEKTDLIIHDIDHFNDVFTLPNDVVHITALFIGGKQIKNHQKATYNQFKNDQKKIIKIDCLVYIPGFILAGYVKDTDGVLVQNQFPHVTLFLANGTKAVQSNGVIQALNKANKGMLQKGEFQTAKYNCQYGKFQFAYVIKRKIEIKGITGNNFAYGRRK